MVAILAKERHVLKDLITVQLHAVDIHEKIVGNRKTLVATVPTNTFLNTQIPNKANSRDFTGIENPSVKAMISTLRLEPHMFYSKNLGIRMVASDIIRNGNKLTLFFDADEGIFNGGHTYEVLKKHGNAMAFVEVLIQLDLPKEKLVEISLALNLSKKLELTSQNEKVGAFQWVKDALPNESIKFKEGDQGSYDITDVLKVANLFRMGKGNNYAVLALNQSLKSISSILRANKEKQDLKYTRFILPDMWELIKKIKKDPVIMQNFPKAFTQKGEIPQGMSLCLLSGVQYLTEINKNNIPKWKEGMDVEKALTLCQKVSKKIGKLLNRYPFKEMRANGVEREPLFQAEIRNIFLEELAK